MKVCILILVVAIAGANANAFSGIGDYFKAMMAGLKETGRDLFPYTLAKVKDMLKGAVKDGLSGVSNLLVDAVSKSIVVGRRDLSQIINEGEKLKAELENLVLLGQHQFNEVIEETMAEIKDIHDKLTNLVMHPDVAIHKLEQVMEKHTHLSKEFLQALERDANMIVSHFTKDSKRGIKETLHATVQTILDAFKPHIQHISEAFKQSGEAVHGIASNFMAAIKTAMMQLGTKMTEHGHELLGTGVDALNAMKAAATDILQQTSLNVKPVLQHMIDSTKNVGTDLINNIVKPN